MPGSFAALATPLRMDAAAQSRFYGILFAIAALSFCAHMLLQDRLGFAAPALNMLGSATCAWSWLAVRAVFRPGSAKREIWPLCTVIVLVLAEAAISLDGAALWPGAHLVGNIFGLATSAMLVMAAIEPIRGWHAGLARAERHFRAVFATGYVAILLIAVVWVNGAPEGSLAEQSGDAIKATCAVLALGGIGAAIGYRLRNPLIEARAARFRPASEEDADRGTRITTLLEQQRVYLDCELRVSALARMIGEPEYKVTQAITGVLGFRNFNEMVNEYRLRETIRRFSDPGMVHLPILTIALDCGFGSIGVFNRAFKAHTGMTPRAFRDQAIS